MTRKEQIELAGCFRTDISAKTRQALVKRCNQRDYETYKAFNKAGREVKVTIPNA